MFQHILLPSDLGQRSWVAADAVRDLARADPPPTVTLIHVIEVVEGAAPDEYRTFYDELEARSRQKLEALASYLAGGGVQSHQHVAYGRRAETIVGYAADHGVDLIVLASHPVGPGRGRGWGSLSYKVGLMAACAVLLVKAPLDDVGAVEGAVSRDPP